MGTAESRLSVFHKAFKEEKDFWIKKLEHDTEVTELATDFARSVSVAVETESFVFALSGDVCVRLSKLAGDSPFLIYAALMAGLQVCLHKHTGSRRIRVGSPARLKDGEAPVNALAIVTEVDSNIAFRALLMMVRETLVETYSKQNYPYKSLLRDLDLDGIVDRCPLFGITLALKTVHGELPPLNVDVAITFEKNAETISGRLEYSKLFRRETLERFVSHYLNVLEVVTANINILIRDVEILSEAERQQLLFEWNNTTAPRPEQSCLHRMFEAQVERAPEAVAVETAGERLSYLELDRRANRLAVYLRARGVKLEDRVGVCMERSLDMIVALLGVLKAGAAYLPLDPTYPHERLAFMVQDAGVKLLLTSKNLASVFPVRSDITVVQLDAQWKQISAEDENDVLPTVDPRNAAYVIYTSGSTGHPKGVLVQHGGVCNMVAAQTLEFDVQPESRVLQFASLGFDASVSEIFTALAVGATLFLADRELLADPESLAQLLNTYRISVVTLPPAVLNLLDENDFPNLRTVIAAGEACSAEVAARWSKGRRFINAYGPTEASVCTTLHHHRETDISAPPIGGPISNARVYILNADLQPVPAGVAGELYIAGDGLARGYLSRPELTAEKFIPDPFSREGERLYRSGDLCRWLASGEIEFLRRIDNQVKLRGFRVELGEIEAVLRAHRAVRDSVVVISEAGSGDKRLVAYVVVEGGEVTENAFRSYLKERLPEYMVPPVFMLLDELPLTANGKVDRRRLPEPEGVRPELRENYVAPTTRLEELVAGIWAEVLGLERVGINDNFFDLGGHSLIATQVMVRVRRMTDVELPLRVLFEGPTVAKLAAEIEAAPGAASSLPPLLPVRSNEEPPLSFAQQRLWFLDQLEPGSAAYNCPAVVRFRGALNIAALEQSLNEVVRRHEALRTSFHNRDGHPLQVIAHSQHVPLPVLDLGHLPADRVEAELQKLSLLEGQRAFDLSRGPLLRTKLLRVSAEEHVALLTMHHIISDGWSIGVLVREVAALYAAYADGHVATLEPLSVQYADYAYWEREWLQGEVLAEQMNYWKQQLGGAPVLELPTDHPRPYVQTYRGAYANFYLDRELSSGLSDLSRRLNATLFMTLLAAWQTLLYRYSGQTDIVVGSPIANRQRAETEALIGFFVNTLALRTDLSGNPNFSEVVQRVRETALGAYAHQAVPFEKVIEELQPERDASHTPLMQVVFVLQNAPQADLTALDLKLTYMEVETDTAKFDLTLALQETAGGLSGRLEYRDDLFEPGTIKRLLAHFENLLRGILEQPDQHIAELPLLSEPEERQLVELWNDTATVYERDCSIHELFEAQAEQMPEALAVISNDAQLNYRELSQRSNQFARHLQSLGVASETLVGVSLARSAQLVIALLGILKAGGAYVFLDASYPEERLALMLRDSGVQILITEKRLKEKFAPVVETLICTDADEAEIAGRPCDKLSTPFHSNDQLAYVSYTSGSTGTPKGVAVTHRGVVRLVRNTNYARLNEENVFLQLAPVSFDASTLELWGPLLNGGCCVLPAEQILTATELEEAIGRYGANSLWLTSSMFNAIVDQDVHALSGLQQLLVGGEALSVPHIRRAVEQLPQTQLINGYGPTENTTFTCCFPIKQEFNFATSSIPIGPPVANTHVYILDEEMQPVPIGVPGELYIGGDGLARGYVSRPDLTAEKFVPDPFSEKGERLYRTGDLTRWLTTGEIEFIGRRDRQVKVRGFRIELGEVEAALKHIPNVREAVAGLTRDGSNLVAYVVADEGINEEQIRASLQTQLPAYMVPGQLVLLEQLPLTRHGKVDEQVLLLFAESRDRGEEGGAPVSEVEQTVAEIWGAVLKLQKLGREANFFEYGGHSLLATQAIARIRQRFQIELPLLRLFESPTVAEFAVQIEAAKQANAQPPAEPIKPIKREGELPLSFAQQRFWYLDRLHPGNPIYNCCEILRVTGPLNVPALEQAINEIIHRHETLHTIFPDVKGWPAQVILQEEPITLLVADLSALPRAKAEAVQQRLAGAEAERPFDLSRGPLIRASVSRMNALEHVVQVTMHHIVSDGWSLNIFRREISTLYEAFAAGNPTPLPPLPIQYGDFAVWQRQHLQGERLAEQLSYWKKQLAGMPPVLELPSDRRRPAIPTFHGAKFSFMLTKELSESLKTLSRQEGTTLFMVLLAAFDVLLYRYTYQPDIVVGTAIANRNRAETEPLIGFFVNMLVMRTDMSGNPSFRELLERVKQMTLAAYQHQDVPFEQIIEMLQPQRSLNLSPLYQVEFTVQNAPFEPLETHGLRFEPIEVPPDSAETDFNFIISETENGLIGDVIYSTDLFDATTIERMTDHFQTLLQGIVEEPERRILQLELTTNREAQVLLAQWDGGATSAIAR